ncbi:hypothetical protein GCM10011514_03080 [Emticicia aquatilis]|uniref:GIY-YIG domain-containing protein n=1 Tax=Emticicia aquatilis TaxID=1537369 RepID=A0A916YFE4_9BACT|nr:GIY-YIG nuclease family protein [Emticicia aquatilis]GGD42469.1 hypothetical protein GCM10011514_03080 [Emticicia aquatilis]
MEYINTTQKFNINFSRCLSGAEGIKKNTFENFMRGFMYILECFDGSYYTGSTVNLELRIQQHQNGEGSNHTRKHRPVKLVCYEEFDRIDEAFLREKQIQKWSRKKKEALTKGNIEVLHKLAECRNESHYLNAAFDSAHAPNDSAQVANHSTQRPDIFE